METIFNLVYEGLVFLSDNSSFNYKEINIIIFYYIIPFTICLLLDESFNIPYFKIGFSLLLFTSLLNISSFTSYSERFFNKSADFLRELEIIGLSYVQASVLICVVVPVTIILLLLITRQRRSKQRATNNFI